MGTTIDELSCAYLVPRQHPDPTGVAARLDAAARGPLVERCAGALSTALDPADPSVWVIRNLEVALTLPAGLSDVDDLARLWADGIALGIARVVHGEVSLPAGEVVRYPDRAAYLAAYAADVAAGNAAGRWEYARFDGLRPLDPGRAVISAAELVDVPVAEVMYRLARTGRLAAVLRDIEPTAVTAIWRACLAWAAAADPGPAEDVVWAHRAAVRVAEPVPLAALRLLGAVLAGEPPRADLRIVVAAVARVAGWLADPGPGWPAGDEPPVGARPRSEPPWPDPGPGGVAPRVRADPTAGAPSTVDPAAHPSVDASRPVEYTTPFAGVLLLLPALLDAGLVAASEAAGAEFAAMLRHRVLLRCLGVEAAALAAGDPALRHVAGDPALRQVAGDPAREPTAAAKGLAGLRPEPIVAALEAALSTSGNTDLATIPPDDPDLAFLGGGDGGPVDHAVTVLARAGVRLFARRLIGFGRASAAHLAANAYGAAGVVSARADGDIDAAVEPSPLQVVLDLAGMDTVTCPLPWRGGLLRLHTVGR